MLSMEGSGVCLCVCGRILRGPVFVLGDVHKWYFTRLDKNFWSLGSLGLAWRKVSWEKSGEIGRFSFSFLLRFQILIYAIHLFFPLPKTKYDFFPPPGPIYAKWFSHPLLKEKEGRATLSGKGWLRSGGIRRCGGTIDKGYRREPGRFRSCFGKLLLGRLFR